MSDEVDSRIAAMADAAALPRRNGELVFEAPWQARAFGIGVALCRCGLYEWSDFQRSLAEAISAGTPSAPERGYYEHWLAALQSLLVGQGILSPESIERRAREIRSGERS